MVVGALEITYSAIRLNHPSRELVPWVSLFMPLVAVFYASFTLVVPESFGLSTLFSWTPPSSHLSPQVAITFGLAAIVVWLGFEKRSLELSKKYQYLRKLESTSSIVVLCAAVWAAGVVLLLLARKQPIMCLVLFLALCAVPHMLVRKPR